MHKIDKQIKSEIAISIILLLTTIMGALIVWTNRNWQNDANPVQYTSASPDGTNRIVFLGDSITALEDWNRLFEVSDIKNAGVSGNTTDDVLLRLSEAIASKPQKLFLMIGINDLVRGKDVDYVLANYKTILDRIKSESPSTIVYVQSVLPINNSLSKIGTVDPQKILELNKQLKHLANQRNLLFIDLYQFFCGADNKMSQKYAADGVHPGPAGYEVWKKMVGQYIE